MPVARDPAGIDLLNDCTNLRSNAFSGFFAYDQGFLGIMERLHDARFVQTFAENSRLKDIATLE
jgi:hypothetical protein